MTRDTDPANMVMFGKSFSREEDCVRERKAFQLAGPHVVPTLGPLVETVRPGERILTMTKLRSLDEGDFSEWDVELWSELGDLLRRLHEVSVKSVGPICNCVSLSWCEYLKEYFLVRSEAIGKFSTVLNKFVKEANLEVLDTLSGLPEPSQFTLVHRDIRPANLGRCPLDGSLRLFDFEHCWGGDGLYDLAVVWMDAKFHNKGQSIARSRDAFLEAYDLGIPRRVFTEHVEPIYALLRSIGAVHWGTINQDNDIFRIGIEGIENWKSRLEK